MTKREQVSKALQSLYDDGVKIATAFQEKKELQFQYSYQSWYTKALTVIATLAPDRIAEFKSYYEIDARRKTLGYGTFVIQDFIKNVVPSRIHHPEFDSRAQALTCFFNQITIFKAVADRADSTLANIEGELFADLQDNELAVSRKLAKISPRAAGALVGVVIEGHLQKVAEARGLKSSKKNPTIADLNDPLKAAGVTDTATWRKITYLGDIRNLCSHKKEKEPTAEQFEELVEGAEWLVKNVF